MNYQLDGFTLLELCITVSIIALISLFSMVTFQLPLEKTEQQKAKMNLFFLANELEQYFSLHQSYQGIHLSEIKLPMKCGYHFELQTENRHQYTLAAIPYKQSEEDLCGIFYLDQTGNETISGKGSADECWSLEKN
jgi:prepilin-type N-terminal cleavage/methylation domain-containing protein